MSEVSAAAAEKLCKVLQTICEGNLDGAENILKEAGSQFTADLPCSKLGESLHNLISVLREGSRFAHALSEGDLMYEAPRNFYLFSEYKQLQSNMRHLTWQAQQIAKGDFNQRVDFMGEFSTAFNQMTEGLRAARKVQDELQELYRTRDKFFSIISHDLRSPFNAILGFSDILTDEWDELSDDDRKNFLKNIRSTAHNTFGLLERLLEWSRVQTGKMKFVPTLINIEHLVNENLNLLGPAADKKFIKMTAQITESLFAWADRDAVLLVLRNLIANAIKFTRHGGNITISAAPMNKLVVVTVEDTGVGIAQEDIPRLFAFESQIKTEGTDHEKGTGLGLVLCREIIEKSGGRIWVKSTQGEGSQFSFTLPARPE